MSTQTPTHPPIALPTLTEHDTASYIGMSRPWLRQRRMRGEGPAYVRLGRAIRYRVADLDLFLEAHRVRTDAS